MPSDKQVSVACQAVVLERLTREATELRPAYVLLRRGSVRFPLRSNRRLEPTTGFDSIFALWFARRNIDIKQALC